MPKNYPRYPIHRLRSTRYRKPGTEHRHPSRGAITNGIHNLQAIGRFATEGTGTMPRTQEAESFVSGSISDLGMTGDQAYYATQATWGILWTGLALIGLGGIYNAAKAAVLLR
ncbi:hypothetical protein I6I10_02165 [Corynebacterium glucuronolyticum]|uniref:Uncharacterized protein n=1 Tax=Corynebacterium glucuronolyticum TaxID=39791 RepID=A0A7T4JVC0_9CORY|nr:hypothetical protein [Corynebacterium glucuronolyticum]QQB46769.1 hypothetical protein I6I10_02165 [Corynebacterium glucuronolyticum]WKD62405.1 hypothetical protein CGLUCO_00560 [Corynebacterium glucuronolyticum DSM 44120]SMB81597.1 hypothetical protein SAMN05660745_02455 [Corynebacterium glucuronolyticum]